MRRPPLPTGTLRSRPSLPASLLLLAAACASPEPAPAEAPAGAQGHAEPQHGAHAAASAPAAATAAPTGAEPSPTGVPAWEAEGVRTAYSRGGTYLVKWRPEEGEVPRNEHFNFDLWIFLAGEELVPVEDARVSIGGWMPAHGHGLIRRPRAEHQDDGHYLVKGMLFHMGGEWQLFIDLIVDGVSERTEFDLTL